MTIGVVSAPTNLGLRPPVPGAVPGTSKAPEALREAGLHARLAAAGAVEAGTVLPGRYLDDHRPRSGRLRNEEAVVDHALRLAARIGSVLDGGRTPLVLGGDCSVLVGAGVALARRGRHALVHLDGHTDFRHPGNSDACASLAGEDLAAAVGAHWPAVADLEGRAPYFAPGDVVHLGCRDDDEHLAETTGLLADVITSTDVRRTGVPAALDRVRRVVSQGGVAGYWLHVDVDVLDPHHLSAVDSPSPGGLGPDELVDLLAALAPGATGAQVTVFDPDLDPGGTQARLLADVVVAGLGELGASRQTGSGR